MAYFRGVFVPSMTATLNVAWETIKAKWPENSPCMEIVRGTGGGSQPREPSGNFRSFNEGENTEMTTMNGEEAFGEQGIAEESFSYQRSG